MVSAGAGNVGAVLAAAGNGSRFAVNGAERPKQFFELVGRPLYMWSFQALIEHPSVSSIVVVTRGDLVREIESATADLTKGKSVSVIAGGDTRQESVLRGLRTLACESPVPEIAIVHDAARPFLTGSIIDSVIAGIDSYGACTTGIRVTDTIKKVESDLVAETLDRESLVLVQTPQGARFAWLYDAHKQAHAANLEVTDDGAVLEAAGHKVRVVEGSRQNIKLTCPEDIDICEAIARSMLS